MKRLFSLLLVLSLLAVCFVSAAAEEPAVTPEPEKHTSGDYEYIILEDGTAVITKYSGDASELTIPSELDGIRVTGIGDYLFQYSSFTTVTIPDSVITIGDNPFAVNHALTNIIISPDHPTLALVDGVLFSKPDKRLVYYPRQSTAEIYEIPEGCEIIGTSAFYECNALTSVTIPNSVNSIGDVAFAICNFESISIPDSVVSIGMGAFYYCSLTSVIIPGSVTTIGDYAFYHCDAMTTVTIQDGVTSIGNEAFSDCYRMTSITIPDSVTSIGDNAFSSCVSLTVTVSRDSCAEQYCKDNNINYIYSD